MIDVRRDVTLAKPKLESSGLPSGLMAILNYNEVRILVVGD
jgi:hypothetical protein